MQTQDDFSNKFTDSVEMRSMELVGECEVSSKRVGRVIQCVSKWLFGKKVSHKELPCSSTVLNYTDRAHVLGKYHIAEAATSTERFDLHTDGTSRDQKHFIGKQLTLDSGYTMSVGFTPVVVENATSLLDNVISMLDELSDIYAEENSTEKQSVFRTLLGKMFATMSDRCSVNKSFNVKLSEYKKEHLGLEVDTHFLFCNAHFLLGLSTAAEETLNQLEKDLEKDLGHRLGRDDIPKFQRFKHASGSATCRFVRTGSDVLGPRGDQKSGCRTKWLSFVEETLAGRSPRFPASG